MNTTKPRFNFKQLLLFAAILTLSLTLLRCDKSASSDDLNETANKTLNQLSRSLDRLPEQASAAASSAAAELDQFYRSTKKQALNAVGDVPKKVTDVTADEINNSFAIEYKVVDLERVADPKDSEAMLTALGKDRWDCFHMEPVGERLRMFCARRPFSLMRILGYAPGGL